MKTTALSESKRRDRKDDYLDNLYPMHGEVKNKERLANELNLRESTLMAESSDPVKKVASSS